MQSSPGISLALQIWIYCKYVSPSHNSYIYKGFFWYLPIERISFDEARDNDKQKHKHVDGGKDFVDPCWLFNPKREKTWKNKVRRKHLV